MFANIPVVSPSVVVTSVRNGLGCIFDTAYSQRLTGAISPAEYRASIDRINHAAKSQGAALVTCIGLGMIIGGFVMFIVTMTQSGFSGGPPVTMILGMVLLVMGGIFLGVGRSRIAKAVHQRLTAAVAAENDFYAARNISWRLHALATRIISSRNGVRTVYDFQIEIELNTPTQVVVPVSYPRQIVYPSEQMNAPLLPPTYQQSHSYASQPPTYPPQQSYGTNDAQPVYGTTVAQPAYQPPVEGLSHVEGLSMCQQCQRKLKADEQFCPQCGSRVNATSI